MDTSEIHIFNGVVVKPGDTLVLQTSESVSPEIMYEIRGRLKEQLAKLDVEVIIFAVDNMYVLRKGPDDINTH